MNLTDLLQTASALLGIAVILIGSGWLKGFIKAYLTQSCRV